MELTLLPQSAMDKIQSVSLSTALATNAIVEGRVSPAALLLAGSTQLQVEISNIQAALRNNHLVLIDGSHDALLETKSYLQIFKLAKERE